MSILDDSSNMLVCRNIPQRDRRVVRGGEECSIACQGDACGIVATVNVPFREYGSGGHVDTKDVAAV